VADHLDAAYNLARWILPIEADAEDVVHDAFLRAMNGYAGFRGENARAWILTIVRNTAYNFIRDRANKKSEPIDSGLEEVLASNDCDPIERLLAEERRGALQAALLALPPEYREALVLREFEELSYRQIAAMQSVPVGTVMSRLARAREKLRSTLKRRTTNDRL